jgi:hypothetical protein
VTDSDDQRPGDQPDRFVVPGQAPWNPGPGPAPGQPRQQGGWAPGPEPPLPKAGSARTGPLPLHPMTLGDILDGGFKLLKANLTACVLITAMFVIPLNIISAWLQRSAFSVGILDVINDPSLAEAQANPFGGNFAGQGLAALASMLITPFVAGAVSLVVSASYMGRQVGAGPALAATGRHAASLVSAFVLTHLPAVLATAAYFVALGVAGDEAFDPSNPDPTLLFVVLGAAGLLLLGLLVQLGFMAPFIAVAPAIVVEDIGPIAAIRRSWRLMVPRYWPVLGIGILAGLIAGMLNSVLSGPFTLAVAMLGSERLWPLLALGGILPSLISTPFVAIVATLLYFDARIRREGFDLALTAADLAGGSPVR